MRFDDETRTRLFADMTLDVDPAGSTIEISIDGTWHPCTWQGDATQTGAQWKQTARTVGYFAGPGATASGATVLPVGRHMTQTRVSWPGGDSIVQPSTLIEIAN